MYGKHVELVSAIEELLEFFELTDAEIAEAAKEINAERDAMRKIAEFIKLRPVKVFPVLMRSFSPAMCGKGVIPVHVG